MKPNAKGNLFLRDCMLDALLGLMHERPFQEITVTDITRRAGVSRMAYYRNYSSKEEILTAHLNALIGAYFQQSELAATQDHHISKRNMTRMFEQFQQQRDFLLACDEAGLGHHVLRAITDYLMQHFSNGTANASQEYLLCAYASSIYTIAIRWLRKNTSEKPAQLAELLYAVYGEHI